MFKRSLLALGTLAVLALPAKAAETYTIDPVHSTVIFGIKHLGVSNFYGQFTDLTGSIVFDDKNPAKSTVSLLVKASSVDTHNAKRDEHVKSPDFLNSKQFPNIAFKSKSVKKISGDTYQINGSFSMHGVTKPLSITFKKVGAGKDPKGQFRAGGQTTFTIRRSDFGMNYMQGGLGNEIQLIVSVEGVRK